jgi:hypothetical protein
MLRHLSPKLQNDVITSSAVKMGDATGQQQYWELRNKLLT